MLDHMLKGRLSNLEIPFGLGCPIDWWNKALDQPQTNRTL
jgi:hypothetical protein